MVIARPAGTEDVRYRMVARPLLERLEAVRGEVELTVLRPPTFGALTQAVRRPPRRGSRFMRSISTGTGPCSWGRRDDLV